MKIQNSSNPQSRDPLNVPTDQLDQAKRRRLASRVRKGGWYGLVLSGLFVAQALIWSDQLPPEAVIFDLLDTIIRFTLPGALMLWRQGLISASILTLMSGLNTLAVTESAWAGDPNYGLDGVLVNGVALYFITRGTIDAFRLRQLG